MVETWRECWTEVVAEACRQHARLAPYRDLSRVADWLRVRHQAVADARRRVSALGDTAEGWGLARLAARVATEAAVVEAALDEATRRAA